MKTYQYEYHRHDRRIKTRWYADRDAALERMEKRLNTMLHHVGVVAGDGNRAPDGSHSGCPRANGLLCLNVREGTPVTILHDGSKTCLKIELAPDILAAYIEMNGRTYYIDDCNGEFVMDSWTPGEEEGTP